MSAHTIDCEHCKQEGRRRAAFVFLEDGISVHLRHGSTKHPEKLSIEQIKHFLAMRGYAVVELRKVA